MLRLVNPVEARIFLRHSTPIINTRQYFQQPANFLVKKHTTLQSSRLYSQQRVKMDGHGDVNNKHVMRETAAVELDVENRYASLAIPASEDSPEIREQYRPFLQGDGLAADDWVSQLELGTTLKMVESEILEKKQDRLRILVLYGSLRSR